ncbi:right-handed parallel beta-helix repeat-containing protein, partial [candidate division KSB1 bacterium]|nr:right-handed parallel beta-helix repeat-containing protein [candidate division KSB1 bacterium]
MSSYKILLILQVFVFLLFFPLLSAAPSDLCHRLPDGKEMVVWQNETLFTKTLVINQNHPKASDSNPGTEELPFRSINAAAQIVQPGERIVIHEGIYREKIVPKRGGKGPDSMISYLAFPGDSVVIKGSRIVQQWVRSKNPAQFSQKLWMKVLADSIFPEENPFALQNASVADIEIMPWAAEWAGRVPYTLRRGMVFQNGEHLVQLSTYEDLPRVPGSFWVDSTGFVLHVHPFKSIDPNTQVMEVTVLQHLFKPDTTDLGYIQIKGLTFTHAGNGLPRTGTGAVFTNGGHHWLIEDNFVSQVNSVGIEIGARSIETSDRERNRADGRRAEASPGGTIVRHNVISWCGTGGVQGYVNKSSLVENNHFYNIGWQDVERYWECAAVKLLKCTDTVVRRNLIHDIMAGSAVWLDWDNKNCRITQNTVYDLDMCCNGALFIEASREPNLIDHNILWDIRGVGIYGGDSDELIIAHNLIGPCTRPGVLLQVATDRVLRGRPFTSRRNRI